MRPEPWRARLAPTAPPLPPVRQSVSADAAGFDPEPAGGSVDQPPQPGLPYADWPLSRTVWGVVAGLVLGGVLLPVPVLIADPELDTHGALIAVQTILGGTLVATALIVAAAGRGVRAALPRLGLRRFRPSAFGWMLAAYGAYVVAIALYAALVVEPDQEDIARELGLDSETVAAAFSLLLIAVLAPISEELFFRGMLFGGLRARMPALAAALVSGIVFGALHATTGITTVPPLVIFGVALALLYEKTGSLWPPIMLHFVNNSLALALSA